MRSRAGVAARAGLEFLIRRRWTLDEATTMRSPPKVIEPDWCARQLTRDMLGKGAQRAVNSHGCVWHGLHFQYAEDA